MSFAPRMITKDLKLAEIAPVDHLPFFYFFEKVFFFKNNKNVAFLQNFQLALTKRVLSLLGWFTVQKTSILHELFGNQHWVNTGSTGQHFLLTQSVEKPKNKKLVVTMFWVNILC